MMSKKKSYLLRVDPKLWDDLNAWAAHELRSVNGQIEFILRDAVRRRLNRTEKNEPSEGKTS